MRYVTRDEDGKILAVYADAQYDDDEPMELQDPELIAFVSGDDARTLRTYLAGTDAELLRIIEDLVNVLIDRNLILLTDFPEGARNKLLKRKAIREKLLNF